MRQSPEQRERVAGASRPSSHFRGWFLALVVLGWLGGWALAWWRGLPGALALGAVVALLLVADARGLFTLRGRLPWGRTGTLGRALLVVLVVALLPLVVSFYLLAAIRRYASARRLRVASIPVALAAEPPSEAAYAAPPTEEAPATRPLPSSLPLLGQRSATSYPTPRAAPYSLADDAPLAATIASTPEEEWEYTAEDGSTDPAQRNRAGRWGGGRLVGCLVAGTALLLLSCGLLAYAGPARGLLTLTAFSGGKAVPTSTGATSSPSASSSDASGGLTPSATPSTTPTPTATATATMTPTPIPTRSAATPTPTPTHAPGNHSREKKPPRAPTKPKLPTPPPVPTPPWGVAANGGQANPFGLAGPLQVVFTCAPDQLAALDHICFYAPPGSQVEAVIHARCVVPYTATLDARHGLTPDDRGALAWTWRPQRACQTGGARVTLRITLHGFTFEVPVRQFRVGGR
jgi:hypothetical protein